MSKINIQTLMRNLDSNVVPEGLDKDELKKNIGWLIPQYYTAVTANQIHAEYLEKFGYMNEWWKNAANHPTLALKLLAIIGNGNPLTHKFVKRGHNQSNEYDKVFREYYPDANDDELDMCKKFSSDDEIQEMMDSLGLQQKDQATIWKKRKSYNG